MIEIRRLTPGDVAVARRLFTLMSTVFGDEASPLGDAYLARLLERQDFWAIAASIEGELVGGLTAHTLPMTRSESSEIFIYDIAVREACQRRGIGRTLMRGLSITRAAVGLAMIRVQSTCGQPACGATRTSGA